MKDATEEELQKKNQNAQLEKLEDYVEEQKDTI